MNNNILFTFGFKTKGNNWYFLIYQMTITQKHMKIIQLAYNMWKFQQEGLNFSSHGAWVLE